ncbi:unnamed protein product [Linum tenue]|uniref:malate dehydrogenase n=1 Tax=Linum tenue TaxID=586396 RepID=A0AAV0I9C5_9ROSI|nr:unnamed protein product [Linum tenue]
MKRRSDEPSSTTLAYRARLTETDVMLDIIQRRFEGCRRLPQDEVLQLVDGEPPIEIDEPPDKSPILAAAEISLSALTGVFKPTIIRFDTTIHQESAAVLVDSGSSHNFVSREAAGRLFLRATAIAPFEVKVINGGSLLCQRYYEAVPIEIQGIQLQVDLYELPLRETNVVLGCQWLELASPISFDWKKATMRFKYKGSWVTLQGAINSDNKTTAAAESSRDSDVTPRRTGRRNREGHPILQTAEPLESKLKEVFPAVDVVVPATPPATATSTRIIAPPSLPEGTPITATPRDPTSPALCIAIRLKRGRRFYRKKKRKKRKAAAKATRESLPLREEAIVVLEKAQDEDEAFALDAPPPRATNVTIVVAPPLINKTEDGELLERVTTGVVSSIYGLVNYAPKPIREMTGKHERSKGILHNGFEDGREEWDVRKGTGRPLTPGGKQGFDDGSATSMSHEFEPSFGDGSSREQQVRYQMKFDGLGLRIGGLTHGLLYGVSHESHRQDFEENPAERERLMRTMSQVQVSRSLHSVTWLSHPTIVRGPSRGCDFPSMHNLTGGYEDVRGREFHDGYGMINDQAYVAVGGEALEVDYLTPHNAIQGVRRKGEFMVLYPMHGRQAGGIHGERRWKEGVEWNFHAIREKFNLARRKKRKQEMSKDPVRVLVTGAAGQIGYAIVPMVARGVMLGPDQPVILHMLDIEPAAEALKGVVATTDVAEACKGVKVAVMVGGFPRKEGMERKDVMSRNVSIYKAQASALEKNAAQGCKVVVVANPANTNALILKEFAPSIPPDNITCLTRLDHNRALGQIAGRVKAQVSDVKNVIIWGNHSSTQYPDVNHATVRTSCNGEDRSVRELVADDPWLNGDFIATVQQRGAAIIKARKLSSALSAASSACDHIRDWVLGTPKVRAQKAVST